MYPFILGLHNLFRWVALVLAIVATVGAFLGWFGKRQWSERDRKIGSFFGIAMDIQLLLGLILYFVYSPITRQALADFGAAMGVKDLRFFGVEHVFYMVLAVVFAHLGSILARKAPESKAKFQRAAIFFGLSLLLMLLGMPWTRSLIPFMG
jgi:hypothetical protein